jgi:hypothetical protein
MAFRRRHGDGGTKTHHILQTIKTGRDWAVHVRYHHHNRTDLGLDKETPAGPETAITADLNRKIICGPQAGWFARSLHPCRLNGDPTEPVQTSERIRGDVYLTCRDQPFSAASFSEFSPSTCHSEQNSRISASPGRPGFIEF